MNSKTNKSQLRIEDLKKYEVKNTKQVKGGDIIIIDTSEI